MIKEMLDDLKGKVSSIDELRKIADSKKISYTEEELETAFLYLNGNEVDLSSLENISGGHCPPAYSGSGGKSKGGC